MISDAHVARRFSETWAGDKVDSELTLADIVGIRKAQRHTTARLATVVHKIPQQRPDLTFRNLAVEVLHEGTDVVVRASDLLPIVELAVWVVVVVDEVPQVHHSKAPVGAKGAASAVDAQSGHGSDAQHHGEEEGTCSEWCKPVRSHGID